MTDIIAETEELMRQERIEKFWKENGKTLLLFVVATVILTGLISAYRTWDAGIKARGTNEVLTLMDTKDFPDNIKDAKLDVRPGLRGILLLNGAQAYLDKNKADDALALYTRAANDTAIPNELQDLAILMEIGLTKDAAKNEALLKKLDSVARGSSPWHYHARVEIASLYASKSDYKTARTYLNGILDQKDVPDTLYKKAEALDHVYALKEKEAAPKEGQKEGT